MRQLFSEVVRALFIEQGRLVSVRGLIALVSVGTLCGLTIAEIIAPDGLLAVTAGAVAYYFKDRSS